MDPEILARLNFRSRTLELAQAAVASLEDGQPMTLRHLFYRLISSGHLDNAKREYDRLTRVMTIVREAGAVSMDWIVDNLRETLKPASWTDLEDYGDTIRYAYRRDFWHSLPYHVEVFCEKDATAGCIQPVTERYNVGLSVCRGYPSVSFVAQIAERWKTLGYKKIYAFYCGDHDPTGIDIERALCEKLENYTGLPFMVSDEPLHPGYRVDGIAWCRLAILPADFAEFDLIRLPAKVSDTRHAGFVERYGADCAELDALPPDELRRRVEDAITTYIDPDEWARLEAIEDAEKERLDEAVDGFAKAV